MYKFKKGDKTQFNTGEPIEGQSIEQRVRLMMNNKEPITDKAPRIYTEREQGVLPELDIRTDRWEHGTEIADKMAKDKLAKRMERHKPKEDKKDGTATLPGAAPAEGITPQ